MHHWWRSAGSGFSHTASTCPCRLGIGPRCFLRHGSSIWRTVLAIRCRWSQVSRTRRDNSSACDTKAFGSFPSSASPSSISSLFGAGTLLGVTPNFFAERSIMIFAAILFALLCSLNCVSIAIWERDLDRIQCKHSIATRWAHANSLPRVLLFLLLAGSVVLALLDPGTWPVVLCLGAS